MNNKILISILTFSIFLVLIISLIPYDFNTMQNYAIKQTSNYDISLIQDFDFIPVDLKYIENINSYFVLSLKGEMYKLNDLSDTPKLIFDFSELVKLSPTYSEGALGFAIHPNFSNNFKLYIFYVGKNSTNDFRSQIKISEFQYDLTTQSIDINSEVEIIKINQEKQDHQGGTLLFDDNGLLFISIGDGWTDESQNLNSLFGKILRINVDEKQTSQNYTIPFDNPYVGLDNTRAEIYAYGFRNPFRMSYDSSRDIIWVSDSGENTIEEINILSKGGNFGWNITEGNYCFNFPEVKELSECDTNNMIFPVASYNHTRSNLIGGYATIGGLTYTGVSHPELVGKFIFGDYLERLFFLEEVNNNFDINFLLDFNSGNYLNSLSTSKNNEIILLTYSGEIFELVKSNIYYLKIIVAPIFLIGLIIYIFKYYQKMPRFNE